MPRCTAAAAAFAYPSRFEGFGIPIVEAMASAVPVVASSHPSLDEASGDAALRADPDDPDAWSAALAEALARRDELVVGAGSSTRVRSPGRRPGEAMFDALSERLLVRVGIDVSPLVQTRAGTARYLRAAPRPERVRADRVRRGGPAATVVRAAVATRWYSLALPRTRSRRRRAALSRPSVARSRQRCRWSLRVLDLAVLRHPGMFNQWSRRYSRFAVPRVVQAAAAVITISEFTKRKWSTCSARRRRRCTRSRSRSRRRSRPTGPRAEGDYVLAVGTLEPRKNLARVVEAAKRVGVELRVVGAEGWGGVKVDGWVGPRLRRGARRALPRRARCLVYPSLYEGFGLPVLEAMACGTPVVTSRGGATEEVAGDAAVLVDPLDVDAIARGHRRGARAGATSCAPRASSVRRRSPGTASPARPGPSTKASRERPLVVIDADVLGRHRTGDETYVENLLRAPARARPATSSGSPR